MSAPVFVVGLPRSGSTLLSRLLNESPDIMSVNDLYYVQAVLAVNAAHGPLPSDLVEPLLDAILDLVVIRGSRNNAFIGQFELDAGQAARIRADVLEAASKRDMDWAALMDETLSLAARTVGKKRWADKTPQNFMHMDLLRGAFPDARFIFLLRDPRSTLVSFKYAAGSGHDPRRYHPVAYALYWRTAARALMAERNRDDVELLRFEDLVGDVAEVSRRLGLFLETDIAAVDLSDVGNNSSFRSGRRKPLTTTEVWLVQRMCAVEMESLGYGEQDASPRLRDVPELLWLTARFTVFQFGRLLFSADGRKRILTLAGNMLRSR